MIGSVHVIVVSRSKTGLVVLFMSLLFLKSKTGLVVLFMLLLFLRSKTGLVVLFLLLLFLRSKTGLVFLLMLLSFLRSKTGLVVLHLWGSLPVAMFMLVVMLADVAAAGMTVAVARLCRVYMMRDPVLMTTDLDIIKEVFIKDFNNFCGRVSPRMEVVCW